MREAVVLEGAEAEPPIAVNYVEELAQRTLMLAAHFAEAALRRYGESYPDQLAALVRTGCDFSIQIRGLRTDKSQVALVALGDGQEVDVATVLLTRKKIADVDAGEELAHAGIH